MLFASFGTSAADVIFGLTPTRFPIGVEGPAGPIRPVRADPFPSRMAAANYPRNKSVVTNGGVVEHRRAAHGSDKQKTNKNRARACK